MNRLPLIDLPLGEVLVVSPSDSARTLLGACFQHHGRVFHHALGGAEAMSRIGERTWRSLLVEDHLPDLNALELQYLIRRRFPRVPVMLLHRQKSAPSRRSSHEGMGCAGVRVISQGRESNDSARSRVAISANRPRSRSSPAWNDRLFGGHAEGLQNGALGGAA